MIDHVGHEPGTVLDGVRFGDVGALLPPVVMDGPGGTATIVRHLAGPDDAAALAEYIRPAFLDYMAAVWGWYDRRSTCWRDVVDPLLLAPTNTALFAPAVSEAFLASLDPDLPASWLDPRRLLDPLELFLDRLRRDLAGPDWPATPELAGPVTGLAADGEETHNGGQRVIKVDLAGGGAVAYKPRPIDGERLYTAVGALLNQAPRAARPVRFPTLACWGGPGYGWQRWVHPAGRWATLRTQGPWTVRATMLDPPDAARFWREAGVVGALCFGLGATDLHSGNVIIGGTDPGPGGASSVPRIHVVDAEVRSPALRTLFGTGLLYDGTPGGHHHAGIETCAGWCGPSGPSHVWRADPSARLVLQRRTQAITRSRAANVVVDRAGRTGYGAHLSSVLRGMFDAWAQLCRHRVDVGQVLDEHADGLVRVLRRPTATYEQALAEPGARTALHPAEQAQLYRGDVPYFLRRAGGGPVLEIASAATAGWRRADLPAEPTDDRPATDPDRLELAGLGVALRDAVAAVLDDPRTLLVGRDDEQGVHLGIVDRDRGAVGFDWSQVGRRVTYAWSGTRMRVRIDPLVDPGPPRCPDVRDRLLRLSRVDAPIRTRWAAGGFTDDDLRGRLTRLVDVAVPWLASVLDQHGFPGHAAVGVDAAAAASHLAQHTDDLEFQERYLTEMTVAAVAGDAPWPEVAMLTDTVLLGRGRPQRYGSKFDKVDGVLRPCPLEPGEVDARRAQVGLGPLDEYARQMQRRFGEETP